jgi:hypothetical protein
MGNNLLGSITNIGINEHAQLRAVTERKNAAIGLGNLLIREVHHVGDIRICDRFKTDGFPEPWRHRGRCGMTRHGRHASKFRSLDALVGQSCRDTMTPPVRRNVEASNASALRECWTDCDSPYTDHFT